MILWLSNWILFWIESTEFILNWLKVWIEFWVSNIESLIELNHFSAKFKHWIKWDRASPTPSRLSSNDGIVFAQLAARVPLCARGSSPRPPQEKRPSLKETQDWSPGEADDHYHGEDEDSSYCNCNNLFDVGLPRKRRKDENQFFCLPFHSWILLCTLDNFKQLQNGAFHVKAVAK